MDAILTQAFEWFTKNGTPGWLIMPAILFGMCVLVVHSWLVRADPAGIARSVINSEKRRLEHMLTQEYLNRETRALIERELRQRSLWKLTRLFNHRLQDLAVLFAERYNVRASYLSLWRTWLSEREGKIHFNRTWYMICLCLSGLNVFISTTLLIAAGIIIFHGLSTGRAMLLMLLMTGFIWLPWLMLTLVPLPGMTRRMEAQLAVFNSQLPTANDEEQAAA
ncbi:MULTISPECIES: hypothetical protein [Pantoea]|jgi:hypothetical protein|uniref:Uncharacterized protein n=1 Tax=Pantoea brenneri TaxID=472694 RepID=A0A653YHS5_9GAMM|nr:MULTISPECIES: hypothetical protein [Pantoea]MBZ6397836.1 hypothetical protein [Pantoea sp.]MBZ6441009.1 hypothetical protein [Pantoea sp.]MDH1088876.1 hypothetical protein [Pantoea brenneri]MDU4129851.1 hypothetical protein [Pantoea sp.]MDU7865554.1 hypothetical protein [Pantoea sp.]